MILQGISTAWLGFAAPNWRWSRYRLEIVVTISLALKLKILVYLKVWIKWHLENKITFRCGPGRVRKEDSWDSNAAFQVFCSHLFGFCPLWSWNVGIPRKHFIQLIIMVIFNTFVGKDPEVWIHTQELDGGKKVFSFYFTAEIQAVIDAARSTFSFTWKVKTRMCLCL